MKIVLCRVIKFTHILAVIENYFTRVTYKVIDKIKLTITNRY